MANGAVLAGFTLTNGATSELQSGGGVHCESFQEAVSNCVLTGNSADYRGGGSFRGYLKNCTLRRNSNAGDHSFGGGGGAYSGRLDNCMLIENRSIKDGGGANGFFDGITLSNCTLVGNVALGHGGGAFRANLYNCMVVSNSAGWGGGANLGTLRNCALLGNEAFYGGGGVAGGDDLNLGSVFLNNCSLVGNIGYNGGGGADYEAVLSNCILYDNTGLFFEGKDNYTGLCQLNYSCTTSLPASGIGNITNAPLFVDLANGNLRLQSNSPCINSGRNVSAGYPRYLDLDGNPRISGGTVDIGAYEFQSPSSLLSYAWAQHYGLPTDGSGDYSDSDSDLLNNWQEWIAGTIPNDASSALRLLAPTTDVSGTIVTWQSVSDRTYFLERATSLGVAPAFSILTSNLVGQVGTTSYTDTNAIGPGPFFYRVGVQ